MPIHSTGVEYAPPRRRVLSAIGAVAGIAALGISTADTHRPPVWRWRGRALGAQASLALCDPNESKARSSIEICVEEVERLERIYSLYRSDSELSRLNREGAIAGPSHDLVALLSEARSYAAVSHGAFDVTVQPLWRLYESHFALHDPPPDGPDPRSIEETLRLVGSEHLDIRTHRIRLGRPGMALTLNGIAQGAITDRISDMLRDMGYESVLVELGEIRVAGAPGGRPWRIGLEGAKHVTPVSMSDGAVATSAGHGLRFESSGRFHHLFDPATGHSAHACRAVSVFADRAAVADALSTAIAVAGPARAPDLLAAFDGESARLVSDDGRTAWIRPASDESAGRNGVG
jgi:thiamine biosynthesis lipoprotein